MCIRDRETFKQEHSEVARYEKAAAYLAKHPDEKDSTQKAVSYTHLAKLNRELEKSEKKLRKAINDEKALQHQLKQLTRKERTHRLCTRGGMPVSYTHLDVYKRQTENP